MDLKQLERWYEQPLGVAFAKMQRAEMAMLLPELKGQRLLQLGFDLGMQIESMISIPYYISLASDAALRQSEFFVVGAYDALPFLSDSMDVVLLNHVLESYTELELVLEEVARVLVPEGQVVIMGLNACSLWGLTRLFKRKKKQIPSDGYFHTLFKVKRALMNVGFNIASSKTFFIRPPIQNARLLAGLEFLEKCNLMGRAAVGAGYLVVARKQVLGVTPLQSRWDFSQLVIDRSVKPVARI